MPDPASVTWPAWNVVADLTRIGLGTRLLDVGCGTGGFCELAAARGALVHGVDGLPDRIARAAQRVSGGDFRVGLLESLPWPDGEFDVVAGFNSFQYAFDVDTALAEARRVTRAGGLLAVSKWGRPADNELFALLGELGTGGALPEDDPFDARVARLRLETVAAGDVPAPITLSDDNALAGALASAGAIAGSAEDRSRRAIAAAAPFRMPDGSYRFENRLSYRILHTRE